MSLKLRGISYTRDWNYNSEWPTNFDHALRESIDKIAKGDSYSSRVVRIEDELEATQKVMANLIEHLVRKGLMNNEEFQMILEQNDHLPDFKLVEVEDKE
jgi:hypothetical protein